MSVHVTAWVWVQIVGDPEAKLVLLKLADQANDDGECWPSRRTIAEACETSVSTVKRRISYLIDKNLLVVEQRRRPDGLRTSNLYTLPYRGVTVGPTVSPPDPTVGPLTDPTVGPTTDPPDGSTVTRQEPSVEPSVEPSLNHHEEMMLMRENARRLAELRERLKL